MPVPEGAITSTQTWNEPSLEVETAEAVVAIEDDEELVKTIEELVEE